MRRIAGAERVNHMQIQLAEDPRIALVRSDETLIVDVQSALDLMATVRHETDCDAMVVPKSAIAEPFFDLKTTIAGQILQKYVNYQLKLAIVGDFSGYTSKALRDFIYESNGGRSVFFVATEAEALAKLDRVL